GDREGGFVPLHHHAQRVADQDQVDAVLVHDPRETGVVRGQHRHPAALALGLGQRGDGPGLLLGMYAHYGFRFGRRALSRKTPPGPGLDAATQRAMDGAQSPARACTPVASTVSSTAATLPWPGITACGAISASGASTKARWCR